MAGAVEQHACATPPLSVTQRPAGPRRTHASPVQVGSQDSGPQPTRTVWSWHGRGPAGRLDAPVVSVISTGTLVASWLAGGMQALDRPLPRTGSTASRRQPDPGLRAPAEQRPTDPTLPSVSQTGHSSAGDEPR